MKYRKILNDGTWEVADSDNQLIAEDLSEQQSDTIVRCVNSHDKLVEALEIVRKTMLTPTPSANKDAEYLIGLCEEALKQAKGE